MAILTFRPFLLLLLLLGLTDSKLRKSKIAPKVWLKSYKEADTFEDILGSKDDNNFDNIFVQRKRNEYAISSEVMEVQFACEADYPVTWTLPDPSSLSGIVDSGVSLDTERTCTFNASSSEPQNLKYYAYITLTGIVFMSDMFASGYLSCNGVMEGSPLSLIYVYIEGQNLIENVQAVSQLNLSVVDEQLFIPCRPSVPDIPMKLYKKIDTNETDNEWQDVSKLAPYIPVTFDTRSGFSFHLHDVVNVSSINGEYKCVVDGDEDIYSLLNVTATDHKPSYAFVPKENVSGTGKMTVEHGQAVCCTGDANSLPAGDSFSCSNEAECDLIKDVFMRDVLTGKRDSPWKRYGVLDMMIPVTTLAQLGFKGDCYRDFVLSPGYFGFQSKLFVCRAPRMDIVSQFITVYDSDDENSFKRRPSILLPQLDTKGKLVDLSKTEKLPIKTRLRIKLEAHLLGQEYPFYSLGLHSQLRRYSASTNGNLIEGQSVVVTCMPHQFYYSKGAQLRLNWKNGTKTVLTSIQQPQHRLLGLRRYYGGMEGRKIMQGYSRSTTVFAQIVNVDMGMKSIDCYAPIWKNEKWEVLSLNLSITNSSLPEMEDFPESSVTLSLNQTGFQINCTVKYTNESIYLRTNLHWEKDGKLLFNSQNGIAEINQVWSKTGKTYVMELLPVTDLSHGRYTCVAENVKGKVRKDFWIFVSRTSGGSSYIMAILSISGSLLATMLAIALFILWRIRQLKK